MPTTQITEITASVDTVAGRTDSAGAAVNPDWKSEERRMGHLISTPGRITPANSWQVVAGGGGTMNIVVGSGTTKTDRYALVGDTAGQGAYIVRLDEVSKTIALDAAHASLARVDEVYLVVYDHAYDGTSRVLPRLVVRKGDDGGGNPGPDAAWEAYILLSRITIPGGAADIAACTFADQRTDAKLFDSVMHTTAADKALLDGIDIRGPSALELSNLIVGVSGFASLFDPNQDDTSFYAIGFDGTYLVTGHCAFRVLLNDAQTTPASPGMMAQIGVNYGAFSGLPGIRPISGVGGSPGVGDEVPSVVGHGYFKDNGTPANGFPYELVFQGDFSAAGVPFARIYNAETGLAVASLVVQENDEFTHQFSYVGILEPAP